MSPEQMDSVLAKVRGATGYALSIVPIENANSSAAMRGVERAVLRTIVAALPVSAPSVSAPLLTAEMVKDALESWLEPMGYPWDQWADALNATLAEQEGKA